MADFAPQAIGIINDSLLAVFDPASPLPPTEGATEVHFFAGEGPATAAWNAAEDCTPFLWTRLARRYRTRNLPDIAIEQQPCRLPRAIAVEIGVGRCAAVGEPSWGDLDAEGLTSLDDSWRIEGALCEATQRLEAADFQVVTEEVLPFGPDGAIIGWSAMIHVQYD